MPKKYVPYKSTPLSTNPKLTNKSQVFLDLADTFIDQIVTSACKVAKLRQSPYLELRDLQLVLERNYNIRIPGYSSDELRTVRRYHPTPGWMQKVAAVQAAKVTGGVGGTKEGEK
jgi:transcription initiation factor TFIID subunit 12